jgi:choline dehydrogenase-like flavoprotein
LHSSQDERASRCHWTPGAFAADYERESGVISIPELAPANNIKVAVIGSGPAGLSFAGDMAKNGFDVYVFEALHEIGGVLKYGIPEFRLPNKIVDVEIENLRKMGVHFQTDCIVGKTISIQELEDKGFKGIFVAQVPDYPISWVFLVKPHQHHVIQRISHPREPDGCSQSRDRHSNYSWPEGDGHRRW